ncbi:hypothetical protein DCC39_14820 [Pueribacillus theae]|uniref:Uncharacterized protein n=1 Tax=Pueribacillus theae TaxID=2171751 RepID=A0A2U1JT87_9BACI|nr:hypothetical protein [Pueribacillus theae]PWA08416.1 hypothetical protein DCC39_14820 [Pueribacillus theae]
MGVSHILHLGKSGLETLLSSIIFFYSHFSLLLVALIPSFIRAYQMWNHLQTPILFEVLVELTRVILFILMFCLMSKSNVKGLKQREFWNGLGQSCALHMKKNWPSVFIAQIIVFIVILYGLGNLLLSTIVTGALIPITDMLNFKSFEHTAAYNAYLYFLKNMSVIPLALVYTLKMFGVRPSHL